MKTIKVADVASKGMPLYDMRTLFEDMGEFTKISMSVISLMPGERIPATGMSCHKEDEYSYIISGEVDTYSGGEYGVDVAGDATLIPSGEEHWCINKGTEPCVLVCFMAEKKERHDHDAKK